MKTTEIAPPQPPTAEDLFAAEAELRAAARTLCNWEGAINRTPDLLNQASRALRAAARRFARTERQFEARTGAKKR